MSEVKWIKIVTDIFDDEKVLLIETLPECDSILVIWLKLLCLAGKQNNSGVFIMQNGMPYTDKMLSIIFRRKETTVKMALDTFRSFGMIEIVEDTITIPNWGKHQNFDKIELKNKYMRQYMRDYRTKQKLIAGNNQDAVKQIPGNSVSTCDNSDDNFDDAANGKVNSKVNSKPNGKANSKSNVSSADKIRLDKIRKDKEKNNSPNKSAYSSDFESFWSKYPSKVAKGAAAKSFKKALKKACMSEIMNGLRNYCNSKKVADGIICNPTTWLNQERWLDVCEEVEVEPSQALTKEQLEHIFELEERIAREEAEMAAKEQKPETKD